MAKGCLFLVAVVFVVLTLFLTTNVSEFTYCRNVLRVESLHVNGKPIQFGLLNAQSAVCKAAHIHDVLADSKVDMLALTESWMKSTDPNAIAVDIAPLGFTIKHRQRSSSTRGSGVALV